MKIRMKIILVIGILTAVMISVKFVIANLELSETTKNNIRIFLDKEPDFEKEENEFIEHLEKKYDYLNIKEGFISVIPRGYINDDSKYGGVFFDENDPGLGIQIFNDENGEITDTFDSKTHQIRSAMYNLLKTHKPDSLLNEYFTLLPVGTRGFSYSIVLSRKNNIIFSVMKETIDIENELESDYKIVKEMEKVFYELFADQFIEDGFGGVSVYYYEIGNFDFDKFMEKSATGVRNKTTVYRHFFIREIAEHKNNYRSNVYQYYYDYNEKPIKVFSYKIIGKSGEPFDVNSIEDYKQLAFENGKYGDDDDE